MRPPPRRFRALLVLLALGTAPPATVRAARMFSLSLEDVAGGRAQVIDLTHDLLDGQPVFPGSVPFSLEPLSA
ncbi:MAG: hypothetical protein ACRD5D_11060, partial [Candidatus Polarisedimenticolia bacterium]